ncbi:MAG: ABC transporter substrate-binding protein [Rhizobiaceae bacterium]|nr:ABC transporter substrate-binding protein [Rhizobiaceae bacterium]
MQENSFTLACVATDRSRPIVDGRITVASGRLSCILEEPEEIFRRALREKAFAITEMSMSSHIVTTARGDSAYVGVPVFLSRAFRHSSIFIRTDKGISRAEDLFGKRIGIPEYQQTAALWVRGILTEQHGVDPDRVVWVVGSQEQPSGTERIALDLPPRIRLERIAQDQTLNAMLANGEIDAIITPRPPSCFVAGTAPVDRLFPDYRSAEIAYHRATGLFPIMHCLAVRKDVAAEHPDLPQQLFAAFCLAKEMAMKDLAMTNVPRATLPWVADHLRETQRLLGTNFWRYGFEANRAELSTMVRYAVRDGLVREELDPRLLFHPNTLDLIDDPN